MHMIKILGGLAMAGLAIACDDTAPINTPPNSTPANSTPASGTLTNGTTTNSTLTNSTVPLRNVVYFDQYHTAILPSRDVTAGITHVIMAFANSSLFVTEMAGAYEPFMPLDKVRAMFDDGTQVGIAIGGWGDTAGFSKGAVSEESRSMFAKNVAAMVETHGFDFVDIDWEYPGGNGADYKQTPNSDKASEITTFPMFLQQIKNAIAPKQLSIAVPSMQRDIIAYAGPQAPSIFAAVDMVNLMSYDMMNRRDGTTSHHTSVKGAINATKMYLDLGLPPSKLNLGFAYYAKYFLTPPDANCTQPIGCPVVPAENGDGSDAGTSGAMTFEKAHVHPPSPPQNMATSSDGTCGADAGFKVCPEGTCCSQYGSCGSTTEYCGMGCQSAYGVCQAPDVIASFGKALANGQLDSNEGGMWYWDADSKLFWTWDSPELIDQKVREIVAPMKLGGVMAWSLGEDSDSWDHVGTVAAAARGFSKPIAIQKKSGMGYLRRRVVKPRGHGHGRRPAH
ncbi:carbohydrate-binding module family 18 protein [Daldinia vernicosa]|uniref:carbohydrate-binding module family 18 protein n=1 Tax=Daldinia vernicosa TaxID=114800 RepID=UPI002008DF01|nr:carbohydrate-binding module family 18 protein [Daldinia vernicosa]KAI0847860.1 carbohydrate-binding module family 18 protein [Daldinia vernicosa]